jgi:glycosyltransferase involved in cell wall biosynthesis
MRKKILIKAPILSRSGYGEQSRFALRALKTREDLYDIYLINIPWGNTGQSIDISPERRWIDNAMLKTAHYVQDENIAEKFDITLQITIPSEFEKIAPVNIGYTAGIETTLVAPEWLQKCNEMMDKIITISKHSKNVFEQTKYTATNNQTGETISDYGILIPVDVVNYPVRAVEPEEIDIELETKKNFLVVSQWGPRKNLDNTIRWFVEEFKNDENVGLILKTNTASDSITDRMHTASRLEELLKLFSPNRKCKIYLLHGEISPGQLTWLYQHPTMKALINIAHGEGYGLPLFEAAYNGLPLVTIPWGGQLDFICKPNKKGKQVPRVERVNYDIKQVQKEAVWPGVIQEDSKWAYARETSYRRALQECLGKEVHRKKEAGILQKHILERFSEEKIYKDFLDCIAPLMWDSPDENDSEFAFFERQNLSE